MTAEEAKKINDTFLQRSIEIVLAGEIVKYAPPTVETLMLVSEMICSLPARKMNAEESTWEALATAKDYRKVGEIIALLVVGAKGRYKQKKWWGVLPYRTNEVKRLGRLIIANTKPSDLRSLLMQLVARLQVDDFFGFTSSLSEISMMGQPATTTRLGQ